ncbi:MAG: hypothetical protein JW384_00695 [Nitrosomonadaceae bacterium]|nr:hypothetical protein [Nitrosomonadaceae bacterium]
MKFERSSTYNDFRGTHLQPLDLTERSPDIARKSRVVELHLFLLVRINDDVIYKGGRHNYPFRMQRTALNNPFHLGDRYSATTLGSHGNSQYTARNRLIFKRNVAIFIGGCASNNADPNRQRAKI